MRHTTLASFMLLLGVGLYCPLPLWAQSSEELESRYLESIPGGAALPEVESQIVKATNAFRAEHNLGTLSIAPKLTDAAEYFAAYMASTGKYGHKADGNRPAQRAAAHGYNYCLVLENIAFVFDPKDVEANGLAEHFVSGWKESQGHRENMLDAAATEIGVAVAQNPQTEKYYAVQMIGRPRSASIRFQLVNKSQEELSYALQVGRANDNDKEPETYELPPRLIRTHMVCRAAQVKLKFGEKTELIEVADGQKYVITIDNSSLDVTEEELPGDGSAEEELQGAIRKRS